MSRFPCLPLKIAPEAQFVQRQLVEHGVGPYVQPVPGAGPRALPAAADRATLARAIAPAGRHAAGARAKAVNLYLALAGAAAGFAAYGLGVLAQVI